MFSGKTEYFWITLYHQKKKNNYNVRLVCRGLNLNPTLKMIDKLGGAKKKGEKFIKLEEVRGLVRDTRRFRISGLS